MKNLYTSLHKNLMLMKMIKPLVLLFFLALVFNVKAQTLTPSSTIYCPGTGGVSFSITGASGSYDLYKDAVYQETAVDVAGFVTFTGTYTAGSYTTVPATNTVVIIMDPIIANTGDNATICSDSCVVLNASGGSVYNWAPSFGLSNPGISNPMACPATTTTYTLTVVSINGCSASNSLTISVSLPHGSVSITQGNASCGLCNGSAIANVSAGTPPFLYSWSNLVTGQVVTGLCPGFYNLTVTDATGCATTDSLVIANIGSLSVVTDTLVHANCANNTLGSITVHGSCGVGNYSYQWVHDGTILSDTTSTINGLTAGDYVVWVTDDNDSSATALFQINSSSNIYASINVTNANCGNNGTATVNAHGANPPFTFIWSDPLHQTSATATGLAQGTYWVTITDTIGCTLIANATILSGCLNIIKGRVFLDSNQNCIQDTGEIGLANKVVFVTPGNQYGSTNAAGDYTISTPNMNNILHAPNNIQPYSLSCPDTGTYTVDFANVGDTSAGNDFGLYSNPNNFDVGIHPGWSGANPGFNKTYWILFFNNSPLPQNVIIRFTYDSLLQYTSCTHGGVHYPMQHKIEWTINNVPPSGYYLNWALAPYIYFYVPTSVNINTILHSCFEILPIAGDANPGNNTICAEEAVTSSHDPNSKDVSPVGETSEGYIAKNDSTLLYNIHFQNDGNDTAFTVIVIDTLSPFLDPATIVPGAASHPYTFDLSGQGVITFRFDNILLPDSNVNEPASNGYVNFTVKQKTDNQEGSVIKNFASNYFDFNPPVNTNTVKNTINSFYIISEDSENDVNTQIYPNPANDYITVETNLKSEIEIFNIQGKLIKSMNTNGDKTNIDISDFSSGMYFVKLKSEKNIEVKKFMKQ